MASQPVNRLHERPPCPISAVTVSVAQPNVRMVCLSDVGTEQEVNRLLLYWSQGLGPNESFDVRLDVAFSNGFRTQTVHHLRSYYPDGTVRAHILHQLAHLGNCAVPGVDGDWWSTQSLSREVQGWPPQADASRVLRRWAINREAAADLHGAFGQAQAEYCAALVRLLDLDYPVMEIPAMASLEADAWNDRDVEWRRGMQVVQRQAHALVLRYLRPKEAPDDQEA